MRNIKAVVARVAPALLGSLGQPIQYQRISADPEAPTQDLVAVFNNAATSLKLGSVEVPVTATNPTLFVIEADLGFQPAQGDRAIIAGETWTVVDVHPDGQGGSKLELHRGAKVRW